LGQRFTGQLLRFSHTIMLAVRCVRSAFLR
jgi:hypothetical protein